MNEENPNQQTASERGRHQGCLCSEVLVICTNAFMFRLRYGNTYQTRGLNFSRRFVE